jgi:hypothetical protein
VCGGCGALAGWSWRAVCGGEVELDGRALVKIGGVGVGARRFLAVLRAPAPPSFCCTREGRNAEEKESPRPLVNCSIS